MNFEIVKMVYIYEESKSSKLKAKQMLLEVGVEPTTFGYHPLNGRQTL